METQLVSPTIFHLIPQCRGTWKPPTEQALGPTPTPRACCALNEDLWMIDTSSVTLVLIWYKHRHMMVYVIYIYISIGLQWI